MDPAKPDVQEFVRKIRYITGDDLIAEIEEYRAAAYAEGRKDGLEQAALAVKPQLEKMRQPDCGCAVGTHCSPAPKEESRK